MSKKIIIDGHNIKSGGGLVLFIDLINSTITDTIGNNVYFVTNSKIYSNLTSIQKKKILHVVKDNFFSYLIFNFSIKKILNKNDQLIRFGNFPPFFYLNNNVILFFQNRLLLTENLGLFSNNFQKLKIIFYSFLFVFFKKNINITVVQTNLMKKIIKKKFGLRKIKVVPFVQQKTLSNLSINNKNNKPYDFAYISLLQPHKNHINVLKALSYLAKNNIFVTVFFTLTHSQLTNLIKESNIENFESFSDFIHCKVLKSDQIPHIYNQTKICLYASKCESFGLPLIEAFYYNLPLIAPDLDYVHEIIEPSLCFDCTNPIDIAQKMHFGLTNIDTLKKPKINIRIYNSIHFLKELINS